MRKNKPKTIMYRRKRQQKTNYQKRLRLLFAQKPRLVVRMTNKKLIAQLISFKAQGDTALVAVESIQLQNYGWKYSLKNTSAAYLTGVLIGKKAVEKKITEAVLDTGLLRPLAKGKLYAFLRGVLDAGLQVPHDESVFPAEERITGAHVAHFAQTLKGDEENYTRQFAEYLKNGNQPEKIVEQFEQVKKKIME